jgi:hypothetical protein
VTEVRISGRSCASIVIVAGLMTGVLLAALGRATPSALLTLSRLLLVVGGLGLVFMLGVVAGGLWLGRCSCSDHDPGPDGPGPGGGPEPPGSPADDLDRELEALLSGR